MIQHLFPFALSKKMILTLGISTRWGMSQSEVKQSENLKIHREDKDRVYYKDKLFGHEVVISYAFHNNRLYQAAYILSKNKFSSNEEYVNTYNKIIDALTDKYGEPNVEGSSSIFKISGTKWIIGNTEIFALLGDLGHCGITYTNLEIKKEAEKAKEKRTLADARFLS